MTLYIVNQNFAQWEETIRVNDCLLPPNVEEVWSTDELSDFGLIRESEIVDPGTPIGEIITSRTIQLVNGVPTWVYESRTKSLAERKAEMVAQVNAIRDSRTTSQFTYKGKSFQLDEQKSLTRITAMGASAYFAVDSGAQVDDLRWNDPTMDFGWIATDNTVMMMDAQTMKEFSEQAKLWVSRHTFVASTKKYMIMIAASDAALNVLDVNTGWPEPEM